MFKTENIVHASVLVPIKSKSAVIEMLHKKGVCELKETLDYKLEENLQPGNNLTLSKINFDEDYKTYQDLSVRLKHVSAILESYSLAKEKSSFSAIANLFSSKAPKRYKIKNYSDNSLFGSVKAFLETIEPTIEHHLNLLEKLEGDLQQKELLIHNLKFFPETETKLWQSTENISIFAGIIANKSIPILRQKLKNICIFVVDSLDEKKIEKNSGRSVRALDNKNLVITNQKKTSLIITISLKEDSSNVHSALHDIGFDNLLIPFENKKPEQLISDLEKDVISFRENIEKTKLVLGQILEKESKIISILDEESTVRLERMKATSFVRTTSALCLLEAWVPQNNISYFESTVKQATEEYYFVIEEKENAPTLLKNPKIVRPFELLTKLYSLPKPGNIDPTPFIFLSFTIFFGFMMSDAIYGLLLLISGFGIYRGAARYNDDIKNLSIMLVLVGFSTVLLGIFFGSYFGDFFTRIGFTPPVVVDAMKDVMLVLVIALCMGLIHIIVGLVTGIVQNINQKNISEAISRQGIWLIFISGIACFAIGDKFKLIGIVLLIITLILKLTFAYLGGGPIISALSILDFSAFVGDLFSYARLLALALGSSGIALAINFMTLMVADIPYIGIIVAAVIFIVGHIFNLAMSMLGASVHSLRLNYLEFFSKFYDGGGKEYVAFKANRKLTVVDETNETVIVN